MSLRSNDLTILKNFFVYKYKIFHSIKSEVLEAPFRPKIYTIQEYIARKTDAIVSFAHIHAMQDRVK